MVMSIATGNLALSFQPEHVRLIVLTDAKIYPLHGLASDLVLFQVGWMFGLP